MLEIDAGAIECEAALQGSEILQDDIGIQPLHLASNALGGLVWTHGRSQEKERARRRRFLPERHVDQRFELLTKGGSLRFYGNGAGHGLFIDSRNGLQSCFEPVEIPTPCRGSRIP